jgi:hypothetical protein
MAEMNPAEILPVLSAVAAAIWSVWTWSQEQQKERQLKRDQEAALYVNAFIVVTQELQLTIYGILEKDELAFYKKEYAGEYEFGSPAAIKILYRLSQYFGWASRIFRYGPYTRDPWVIDWTRKIAEAWESHAFPGDAFRFSIEERIALGEAVLRRVGEVTAGLPVFEAVSFFEFQEEMSSKLSKHALLYQSMPVRSTIAAIDGAERAETLEGHERLAVIQSLLIDLVTYLENVEGFHVSPEKRKRAGQSGVHPQMSAIAATDPRILHQTRGRIRLEVRRVKTDEAYANGLQSLLQSVRNVTSVRINPSAASVIVYHDADIPEADFATKVADAITKGSSDE